VTEEDLFIVCANVYESNILKKYKSFVKESELMYYASDSFFTRALGTHLHNFYK